MKTPIILAALLLASWAPVSPALMIGINFAGGQTAPGGAGTGVLGAADIAGQVPQANWNNFGTPSAFAAPSGVNFVNGTLGGGSVVDSAGAATGVEITVAGSTNTWRVNGGAPGDANSRLMNGYLDTNASSTTTITVNNIPYATYDLLVYKDGDGGSPRAGNYTANGNLQSNLIEPTSNFPLSGGTFVAHTGDGTQGNFTLFSGLSGSVLTLTGTPANFRAPINGIQIIDTTVAVGSVPEPGTLATFAAAMGGILFVRRRKSRVAPPPAL